MTSSREEAEELGHQLGRCPTCKRMLWSDDCGYFECPRCGLEKEEETT